MTPEDPPVSALTPVAPHRAALVMPGGPATPNGPHPGVAGGITSQDREDGPVPAGRPSLPGSLVEPAEPGPSSPLPPCSGPQEAAAGRPAGGAVVADTAPSAGSRTFTITLPAGLKLLSLNDRGHWATRYRRSQALKEAAWAMALKGKVPRLDRVFVAAVYQPPPEWRERDSDNPMLSVKAAIDGIVAARVLPGDECPRYVTGVYCTIGEPYPAGRLVLNLLADDPVRDLAALAGLRAGAA